MTTARSPAPPAKTRKTAAPLKAYHHGDLPQALLSAAEAVLVRDGIAGLGLRSIAREAGVSHTAPKHHFGDTTGLLSELAAVGFRRLSAAMLAARAERADPHARGNAIGRAYVHFALEHAALFSLMFRNEIIDMRRPALSAAAREAMQAMTSTLRREPPPAAVAADAKHEMAAQDAMRVTVAWAYVHGLATLLIDNRLRGIVKATGAFETPVELVEAILRGVRLELDFSQAQR